MDIRDRLVARVFDYLILAVDRHGRNWKVAVDKQGRQRLVLHDHANVLFELLGFKTPQELAGIESISREAYERLKSIPPERLRGELAILKNERRVSDLEVLIANRTLVLERIEGLVHERGEAAVLLPAVPGPAPRLAKIARREAGGAANLLAAMLLKDTALALARLDPADLWNSLRRLGQREFWQELGLFLGGMRLSEAGLDTNWIRTHLSGAWRGVRATLPLAIGALTADLVLRRDASFIDAAATAGAYASSSATVQASEGWLRWALRWRPPVSGRWGRLYRIAQLAAMLLLGEQVEGGVRRVRERLTPHEGLDEKLRQMDGAGP